jgi:hypothetical protein
MAEEIIATEAEETVANAFLQPRFLESGKCTAENRLSASACQCVEAKSAASTFPITAGCHPATLAVNARIRKLFGPPLADSHFALAIPYREASRQAHAPTSSAVSSVPSRS